MHSATGIGSASSFVWTCTKLAVAMQEAGFYFSRGPTHYDVAREDPAIKAQRTNYIDTVRHYRRAGRTIYYTDEKWANKNMSVYPWMAKIHILGGGHRSIYRLIKKSVLFNLIDQFIRVSSLPNADWATEAVVHGYHPPQSHPQPLPFF